MGGSKNLFRLRQVASLRAFSQLRAPVSKDRRAFIFGGTIRIMEKTVTTLAEFEQEAKRFASTLTPNPKGATLTTLSGELGAGKTAFTKTVARTFGVEDIVTSPTFVLEKIYPLQKQPFKNLIHIDAYRLEKGSDLALLELDTLMKDSDNLILLEWPERVADALPVATSTISFIVNPDGSRIISYG